MGAKVFYSRDEAISAAMRTPPGAFSFGPTLAGQFVDALIGLGLVVIEEARPPESPKPYVELIDDRGYKYCFPLAVVADGLLKSGYDFIPKRPVDSATWTGGEVNVRSRAKYPGGNFSSGGCGGGGSGSARKSPRDLIAETCFPVTVGDKTVYPAIGTTVADGILWSFEHAGYRVKDR